MFDDPNKNPQDAQMDQQEFEAIFDDIRSESGRQPQKAPAEPEIRNFANGYGRAVPEAPAQPEFVYEDTPAAPDTGLRGLTMLASIECLAIAAVAIYWFFHFL